MKLHKRGIMTAKCSLKAVILACGLFVSASVEVAAVPAADYLEFAMSQRDSGSVDQVVRLFRQAAESSAGETGRLTALYFMGDFLLERNEFERAKKVFGEIIRSGTADTSQAYYGIMQASVLQGRPEEAKTVCETLMASFPDDKLEEYALYMAAYRPGSVHESLASIFNETATKRGRPSLKTARFAAAGGSSRFSAQVSQAEVVVVPPPPLPGETSQILYSERKKAAAPTVSTRKPFAEAQPPVQPTGDEETGTSTTGASEHEQYNPVEVSACLWRSGIDGRIEALGMNLDLGNDAGFAMQNRLKLGAAWQLDPNNRLFLNYFAFEHSGSLQRQMFFDRLRYAAGTSVKVETRQVDTGLAHRLSEGEDGSFELLLGARFNRVLTRLDYFMPRGLRAGELDQTIAQAYLGLGGFSRLTPTVACRGAVRYSGWKRDGFLNRLSDIDLALVLGRDYRQNPAEIEWFGVLGWYYQYIHGKSGAQTTKTIFSGPVMGIDSRF